MVRLTSHSPYVRTPFSVMVRLAVIPTSFLLALWGVPVALGQATEPQALVAGKADAGDAVRFDDRSELETIELEAGERLVITVWRSQWHWWASGTLREVKIALEGGASVDLPEFAESSEVELGIGTFVLKGLAKRDDLPEVEEVVEVEPGSEPSSWKVIGSRNARAVRSTDGGLQLGTNGRADWSDAFSFAPALVFQPSESGVYKLTGSIDIQGGQAAVEGEPIATWMVLKMPRKD